jgi:hypothetical protein
MEMMQATERDKGMEVEVIDERGEEEISAAMQGLVTKVAACRLYHEAPNDVFELFVMFFSDVDEDGKGKGGLNHLRLTSKRCMQVVESVATRLTCKESLDTLPVAALKRCKRIEQVICLRPRSLESCPDGLKSLYVEDGRSLESLGPLSACKELETIEIYSAIKISDLSPLSSCTRLTELIVTMSNVTDISPVSSLALLEEVDLSHALIQDLSPLSFCKNLKNINIQGNQRVKNLSPLSQCPDLERLDISSMLLIKNLSFLEKGFTKLRALDINYLPVDDLSPLINLQNLEKLGCFGIPDTTSLLPLVKCYKLKNLFCSRYANDLNELKKRRPDLRI